MRRDILASEDWQQIGPVLLQIVPDGVEVSNPLQILGDALNPLLIYLCVIVVGQR